MWDLVQSAPSYPASGVQSTEARRPTADGRITRRMVVVPPARPSGAHRPSMRNIGRGQPARFVRRARARQVPRGRAHQPRSGTRGHDPVRFARQGQGAGRL